jgi:hypothetical protein
MMQFLFEIWKQYAYSSSAFTTVLILTALGLIAFFLLLVGLHNVYRELQRTLADKSKQQAAYEEDIKVLQNKLKNKDSEIASLTEAKNSCLNTRETMAKEIKELRDLNALLEKDKYGMKDKYVYESEMHSKLKEEYKILSDNYDITKKEREDVTAQRDIFFYVLSFLSGILSAYIINSKSVVNQNIMVALDTNGSIVHVNVTDIVSGILENRPDHIQLKGDLIADLNYEWSVDQFSKLIQEGEERLRTQFSMPDNIQYLLTSVCTIRTLDLKLLFVDDELLKNRFGDTLQLSDLVAYLQSTIGRKVLKFITITPSQSYLYGFDSGMDYISDSLVEQLRKSNTKM